MAKNKARKRSASGTSRQSNPGAKARRRFGAETRIRIPFSVPTLERGLKNLRRDGLIVWDRITHNPQNKARLQGPRNYYSNRFSTLGESAEVLNQDQYAAEASDDQDATEEG